MAPHTAGDPMTSLKWTRKTLVKISCVLKGSGIEVSPNTVSRLLRQMDYRLRVNHKKISGSTNPDRDRQFRRIEKTRANFEKEKLPVVSVDAKKKELVGNFKNPGTILSDDPILVNDHDFPSLAVGKAIPYGVYDLQANCGHVFVGNSHETSFFAAESLARWWKKEGLLRYAGIQKLMILADGGGSNGSRTRAWKYAIQEKLADPFGLSVTICHYPPKTSKWNPIEHRLFSEISKNWAGQPLESYETVLNYIRTTTTRTGLKVKASLVKKDYPTGIKISDAEMKTLNIRPHKVLPKWNYTIEPRQAKMGSYF